MGARRAKRRRIASDPKPSFGSIIQFQHELKTCRFRTHNRPLFPINNLAASIHPSWGRVQRSWRRISRLWPFQKEKRQMKNVESTPMGRRRGPLHFCKSFANFSVDGLPFSVGSWLAIIRSSCCKKKCNWCFNHRLVPFLKVVKRTPTDPNSQLRYLFHLLFSFSLVFFFRLKLLDVFVSRWFTKTSTHWPDFANFIKALNQHQIFNVINLFFKKNMQRLCSRSDADYLLGFLQQFATNVKATAARNEAVTFIFHEVATVSKSLPTETDDVERLQSFPSVFGTVSANTFSIRVATPLWIKLSKWRSKRNRPHISHLWQFKTENDNNAKHSNENHFQR